MVFFSSQSTVVTGRPVVYSTTVDIILPYCPTGLYCCIKMGTRYEGILEAF